MEEDSLFASDSDMKKLTGFTKRNKQIAFLESTNIPFQINGRGIPIVKKSDIEKNSISVQIKKEWRSNKLK